jgi:hypothetical protein
VNLSSVPLQTFHRVLFRHKDSLPFVYSLLFEFCCGKLGNTDKFLLSVRTATFFFSQII